MTKNIKAVILAAGLGTRMKSDIPKVLHHLHGRPMIDYTLNSVRASGVNDIICVMRQNERTFRGILKDTKIIQQKRPRGSADALNQTKRLLKNFRGDILVLYGDEPLIKPETIRWLIREHKRKKNPCTLLSTRMPNPMGYGRIIRDENDNVVGIVEEAEASVFEKSIDEINVGVYCFKQRVLFPLLKDVKNKNKKREYYLTDIISIMHRKNMKVESIVTPDNNEALGVNSRMDLAAAEKVLQKRITEDLMSNSVTIIDPDTTYISKDVKIGKDTVIYPHTIIEKDVKIGSKCKIGPFARIRSGSVLKDNVEIGNFVELVRTKIDKGTKAKHHAYLGDTVIGKNVNIGAGTVVANYDGKKKYVTRIGDGAFIGSGTILVAPIKIGRYATTGAGAVVTKNHNVPPRSVVVGVPARILKNKR